MTIPMALGDSGKRYETRAYWKSDGDEVVIGWSDNPGDFRTDVKEHPELTGWKEIDRQADNDNASTSDQVGH